MNRPHSLYAATCHQCGAEIESLGREMVCPKCGLVIVVEWPCVVKIEAVKP